MKQRTAWQLAGLAAVLLGSVGSARAAVQGRSDVGWLGSGDWQLREQDGEACLVPSRFPKSGWPPPEKRHEWTVNTPTIQGKSGKFLGIDPEGRTASVLLVKDKGVNTRWTFDIVSNLKPGPSTEERGRFKEGHEGFRFRVLVAEGPFKGWYLACEEPPEGKETAPRRLKLVREAREAILFTYVDTNYFVDHK
jgi:hypothetical protein